MLTLGNTERFYVLAGCHGEEGEFDSQRDELYRSNGGEDWICMNSRMEGSDVVHTRFGARSKGITQLFANPWDDTRAVAVGAGPSYWTIVDEGGDEPWVSGEASPGFQIEFTYLGVHFNELDNEKLLLYSMDESFYPRWFTSSDFGNTTNVMGINDYALFGCQYGTHDSVVCDCMLWSEHGDTSLCLTTNFGQTTEFLTVEDEEALSARIGGIWHLDADHSVLYAISSDTGLVFYSVWDGETYPPLQRATLDGFDRVPGEATTLSIVDSYSVKGEFLFLSGIDLAPRVDGLLASILLRASSSSPGVLTLLRDDTWSVDPHFWNESHFTSYGAVADSKLSNQTVIMAGSDLDAGPRMVTSLDYGRTWTELLFSYETQTLAGPSLSSYDIAFNVVTLPVSFLRPVRQVGSMLISWFGASATPADILGLFFSLDYGSSWTILEATLGELSASTTFSLSGSVAISQSPANGTVVTGDLGASWTNLFEGSTVTYDVFTALPPAADGLFERFCAVSLSQFPVRFDCISVPVSRPCQGMSEPNAEDSDFETYFVADAECVGGEIIRGVRKRPHTDCSMIGIDFEERYISTPCQCTLRDFVWSVPLSSPSLFRLSHTPHTKHKVSQSHTHTLTRSRTH